MVDDTMPRYTTKRLKQEIERARENDQREIATLRAEIEKAGRDLEVCQHDNASYKSTVDHLKQRAEAAERLAGARVKVEPLAWGDIDGDIVARTEIKTYRCSKFGDGWDLLIDGVHTKPYRHGVRETYSLEAAKAAAQADYERRILSALTEPAGWQRVIEEDGAEYLNPPKGWLAKEVAEPAGEAEPRQFLATEDGEFNGNTIETPIAAEDGREVDWVDVTGWGVFKGHAIPVDVARYIATKINLYAEHRTTPPDASAIRGALERIVKLRKDIVSDVGTAHKLRGNGASDWMREDDRDFRRDLNSAFDAAEAALAGAKP